MMRRLFLLFPDLIHSKGLVSDLEHYGIQHSHVHAVSRQDVTIDDLPSANWSQKHDATYKLERFLWLANLCVFFSALVILLLLLWQGQYILAMAPLALMVSCYVAGNFFATHIPNAHLSQFQNAIAHREVLLLVDVPKKSLHQVETAIHKHHPEVVVGGVGWTVGSLRL